MRPTNYSKLFPITGSIDVPINGAVRDGRRYISERF